MSEWTIIKSNPGDLPARLVWRGPVDPDERVFIAGGTIPHHPALPAVARWLAAYPDNVAILRLVCHEEQDDPRLSDGEQLAVAALLAALREEAS